MAMGHLHRLVRAVMPVWIRPTVRRDADSIDRARRRLKPHGPECQQIRKIFAVTGVLA
jgi:hypothetical protein